MRHVNREALTLMALGDTVASATTAAHLGRCAACTESLHELVRVVSLGRHPGAASLSEPSAAVWANVEQLIRDYNGAEAPTQPNRS
ncbi:MAG TPA: hypothetical protein VGP24_11250 [Glaciihabitans sp.]|jgi:hypothetical protein|nr:hypothetical protein [Glaciihabitans sp.]